MTLHFRPIKTSSPPCTEKEPGVDIGNGFPVGGITDGQSILNMLKQVMQQVEYHCFTDLRLNRIDPLYKELCLIIAEVLVLDHESVIKINGSNIRAHLVQEVYSQIHNGHVSLVFNNFQNVSHRIYNKKFYLRTALYNSVFELESHYLNGMVHNILTD